MKNIESIFEKFEFRTIRQDEIEQAVNIEHICFPPNEACTKEAMTARIKVAADSFLVAIDKATGYIAGFLNGIVSDEDTFRDEFFTQESLHDKKGKNVMILGLDVLPEYRRQGLATAIVRTYCDKEKKRGREKLILTCLDEKVAMYKKMGFVDNGMADSTWGGEEWHEMMYILI